MQYFISFLEGIITFISPCLLPMLPVYISFFIGEQEQRKYHAIKNAIGFVCGFTVVFLLLGIFAGSIGKMLVQHQMIVNIITGGIVIIFGLNFMDFIHIDFLNKTKKANVQVKAHTFLSSMMFGMIFSIGWTPCVGAFLGSALMMAAQQGSELQGAVLLILYSLGLGIPFIFSAILIQQLKSMFTWIKQHYGIITKISGAFLILIGICMMSGIFQRFLAIFTF